MTLLQAGKEALRVVKQHTLGYTEVQNKVLQATENFPAHGSPFVSLTQRLEIAQLSWDDGAFEQITEILTKRLKEKKKWRRIVKALMVLNYCLQEGSGKFMVYCQVQKDLLDSLESFAYTFEDDRDRGIEIRREARKVAQLLGDPNFLDMRCHAEGAHLMREKTLQSRNNSRRSLRRRGALLSFRRGSGSDANTVVTDDSWASEASAPITIRQKVRFAVSEAVNLDTAIRDIREIARRTSCPDDFMEIMEAILESLLSDEYDKTWGQVFKALVLLRQCLANVSEDVAQHFQGNPTVMRLLRGFQDLEPFHLVGESAAVLRSSGLSEKLQLALPGAIPLAPNETAVAREPPIYAILDPRRDSNTSAVAPVISAFDAFEEKRSRGSIVSTNSQNGIVPRPLPIPPIPVDWSRLHTSAGPQIAPLPNILPPEKAFISSAWRARQSLSLNNDVPRPLPPVPQPVTPSRQFSDPLPIYSSPPQHYVLPAPNDVTSSPPPGYPITPPAEANDDIEYEPIEAEHAQQDIHGVYQHPDLPTDSQAEEPSRTEADDTMSSLLLPPHIDLAIAGMYPEAEVISLISTDSVAGSESWLLPWPGDEIFEGSDGEDDIIPAQPLEDLHTLADPLAIQPCLTPLPPSIAPSPVLPEREIMTPMPTLKPSLPQLVIPEPITDKTPVASPDDIASPKLPSAECLTGSVHHDRSPPLAQGGFSDVFKGTLTHERKDGTTWDEAVAIKVLRAVKLKPGESADDRINKRMHREMNIWSRATHPHIVPLRGYALEGDGTPSLISPWFEHGDVLSYLKKYPFADRRRLVRQVAQGLTYLHAQSPPVIHGDLKGGNVLINSQGDAALCDFGLSKLLQDCPSTFTTSSVGVGTLRWCAPEMWTADEPIKTLATDVWAFGALALEILTGRFPFYKLTNDHKVIFDVTNGVIPAREDYPELPADNKFWDILESCWKQDPDERPSMAQLIELISDDEMFSAVETDA